MLGQAEDALDIESLDLRFVGSKFGKRQFLAEPVALRFVGGPVDGLLVDEHLIEALQPSLDIRDSGAHGTGRVDRLRLLRLPDALRAAYAAARMTLTARAEGRISGIYAPLTAWRLHGHTTGPNRRVPDSMIVEGAQ